MAGEPMPEHVKPMLAKLGALPPPGDEGLWGFEIKWDGVRALAYIRDGKVTLESRSLEDITHRYPELADLGETLARCDCVIDGEVVALDEGGNPQFQLLQRRLGLTNERQIKRRAAETPVDFMAFDILYLDGHVTMALPYVERRALLEGIGIDGLRWQAPRHHVGEGHALLEVARRQGLEGVVGKLLDSPYRPGKRSGEWVKVRNRQRQELVIGGWIPGEGRRGGGIGSLLIGYWDVTPEEARKRGEPQKLLLAGGVGTGFTDSELERLEKLLMPLRRDESPFANRVRGPKRKHAVFCEPKVVCEVEFSEWTDEKTLRQPSYKGMSDDKHPHDVVREEPGT